MITRENELNIDFGLNIIFEGDKYQLVMAQSEDYYPIGGLICEYMRLVPSDIKPLIMSCEGLDEEGTVENFSKTFLQFHELINRKLPPVISTMIALEFMNSSADWFNAIRENRVEEYLELLENNYDIVRKFIFDGTELDGPGGNTVLQILLTSYYAFADNYIVTKEMFTRIMESDEIDDDEHRKGIEVFASMYGNHMDMQHIDYRLILTDRGFLNLYTIKSSFSLLIFDLAHCINKEIQIVKCKNCGNYFVPEGRSDAIYCSYPIRDNIDKTCKDVGAQVTRANKEKNDVATREYRKVYMRYKMTIKRHPENKEVAEKFSRLLNEVREWRNNLVHGLVTTEDFLEWLKQF